jgi:hypothetical protein
MKETAKEIRNALSDKGFNASVVCRPNYTIRVIVDDARQARIQEAKRIVWSVYNSKPHSWLMISVNGTYLPLSAKAEERPAV